MRVGARYSAAQHSRPEIFLALALAARPNAKGNMSSTHDTAFSKRLETAAAAKKALLEKFRPKTAATDPLFDERAAMKSAELNEVREARSSARAAAKQAVADAAEAVLQAEAALAADALTAKRGERKERKALTAAEAKAKRDAKYAARKTRN